MSSFMAISQSFQHSYKRFIDAAKSLDQSQSKPAPQQPTWNTFALPKSSQQAADERERQRQYALAALEGEAEKVRLAPDGTKHDRVRDSAMAVAGFVRSGAISEREIEERLYAAIVDRAEDTHSALQTIRDGIRYGEAKPREIPPPRGAAFQALPPEIQQDDDLLTLLQTAPFTDAGNGECFARVYANRFRFERNRRMWLEWDGVRWVFDAQDAVYRAAIALVRMRQAAFLDIEDNDKRVKALTFGIRSENGKPVREMLNFAQHQETMSTTIDQYDRRHWLAGIPSGTLDLSRQQVREANQGDYITKQLGTDYDPEARCPLWLKFLDEVFPNDPELVRFIQRAIAYSLTGDTREQKLFVCHGKGRNGKSVLLNIVRKMMGDYAEHTPFDTFDASQRSNNSNDLAALKGMRLVTASENDEDRRLAQARVKAMTGQDPITCRFLNKEFFTYIPTYKIWLAVNYKPSVPNGGDAIWERVKMIPFTQHFKYTTDADYDPIKHRPRDDTLEAKLMGELPGILNWALEGLRDWQQHGLGSAASIDQATQAYRDETDLIGQWLHECTEANPDERLPAAEAFASYQQWCQSYGYHKPTNTGFKRSLEDKGFVQKRHGRGNVWIGLRLAEPTDASPTFTVGDVGHDQRATTQARLWLRTGEYAKAKEVARTVRGNREQQALLQEIDDKEREVGK